MKKALPDQEILRAKAAEALHAAWVDEFVTVAPSGNVFYMDDGIAFVEALVKVRWR